MNRRALLWGERRSSQRAVEVIEVTLGKEP